MAALAIVEHLDVFEDVLRRIFMGCVAPLIDELARESPKKAFNAGVVPTVSLVAHAGTKTVHIEEPLVARGRILTAVV